MNGITNPVAPNAEAQRDIAMTVLVLMNDCNLTSDEAIDTLVQRGVIHSSHRSIFRKRYFEVLAHVRPTVDSINAGRWV